jgi:hypothetical protein
MIHRHVPFLLIIPLFLLLISGIGRDDVTVEQYIAKAKDPAFDCVGELYVKGHFGSSCVLIGQRYVITTAHSVFTDSKKMVRDSIETPLGKRKIKRAAYSYPTPAQQITIKINGKKYKCIQVFIHPLFSDTFRSMQDYDLAVLKLESAVTGVTIPELYKGEILNKAGIAVGCGEVGTGDDFEGKKRYKRLKMAGENMIDSVTSILLWADMDHPRLSGFNRMGSDKPLPMEWMGNGGDCGSGLFIEENHKMYLAGVSFSPAYFTDMHTYGKLQGVNYGFVTGWTNLSPVNQWISASLLQ